MKKPNSTRWSAFVVARALMAGALCFSGVALAVIATHNSSLLPQQSADADVTAAKPMPVPDSDENETTGLERMELYWADRVTYPTGKFNPEWLREAAQQDKAIESGVPAGSFERLQLATKGAKGKQLNSLATTGWTPLGPAPERMTGCSGCFDYTKTAGRVNAIVIDPTTIQNGSIVAYAGTVGGGVWKTTNCCSSSTNWTLMTNDP